MFSLLLELSSSRAEKTLFRLDCSCELSRIRGVPLRRDIFFKGK